ncbi:MAG: WbqC family protein [Bacteroidota bacterium]
MTTSIPNIVFSTAYLPPISYFQQLTTYRCIYIDRFENYIKQTYRNRCCIYSANGKLVLSVPVKKVDGNHTKVKDIEIDYREPWQRLHWRAIESAYSNSPFFLYYRDDFEPFYLKKTKYLADLNNELLQIICKHAGIKAEIYFSEKYFEPSPEIIDLRNSFPSKKKDALIQNKYKQVFDEKSGFISNLSIIDLLFNEGKFSKEFI